MISTMQNNGVQNRPAFGAAHLSIKSSLAGDIIKHELPIEQEIATLVRFTDKAKAKDFKYKPHRGFPEEYHFKSNAGDSIILQRRPSSINTKEYITIKNNNDTETLNINPSEKDEPVTHTLYRKLENALYTLVPISKRS